MICKTHPSLLHQPGSSITGEFNTQKDQVLAIFLQDFQPPVRMGVLSGHPQPDSSCSHSPSTGAFRSHSTSHLPSTIFFRYPEAQLPPLLWASSHTDQWSVFGGHQRHVNSLGCPLAKTIRHFRFLSMASQIISNTATAQEITAGPCQLSWLLERPSPDELEAFLGRCF